jgi:hypothetical protein
MHHHDTTTGLGLTHELLADRRQRAAHDRAARRRRRARRRDRRAERTARRARARRRQRPQASDATRPSRLSASLMATSAKA